MPPRMRQALQGTQVRALRRAVTARRTADVRTLLGALLEGCAAAPQLLSMADVPTDVFMDAMCLAAEVRAGPGQAPAAAVRQGRVGG